MARGWVIPFAEIRRRKSTNREGRWASIATSFTGEVWPRLQPSFRILRGQVVFTIGSCFARNIERQLAALGCRIPMLDFYLPPDEWIDGPNAAMDKFHPPAFRQCLDWTATIFDRDGRVGWGDCESLAYPTGADSYLDLDMGAPVAVSRARFIDRRQHIYDVFSQVFAADCLMMTPGLVEAWHDLASGLYIWGAPIQKAMVSEEERWELEVLTFDACREDLLAAIDTVRARNPAIKVMLTTSPVPMTASFTGQDVRVANMHSKSVLRAACGEVAMQRPLVDYFPSYESVTLSNPDGIWREDRLHVAPQFIGKIVARMLDAYLDDPNDAGRYCQLARTELQGQRFAESEQAARTAIAADPSLLEARALLAEALLRQFRCDEAEKELLSILETHADRADLWLARARCIARGARNRDREMIGHIETAISLPSMAVSDLRSVAGLVRKRAEPEAADRITQRIVERFPLNVEAYQSRIDVLLDQRRTLEAVSLLRRALTLPRAPADMYVQLAQLTVDETPAEQIRPLLEIALRLKANHPGAEILLARLDADLAAG